MACSEPLTQKGWNVSAERPERNVENNSSQKFRSSSRREPFRNRLYDENADSPHDAKRLNLIFQMLIT